MIPSRNRQGPTGYLLVELVIRFVLARTNIAQMFTKAFPWYVLQLD
jgi:hypothetical protein